MIQIEQCIGHAQFGIVLAANVCKEFGVSYSMNIDAASHDTNLNDRDKKKKKGSVKRDPKK